MSNRNTIPIDWTRDRMSILLTRLQQGFLGVEDAKELKPLLEQELKKAQEADFKPYIEQLRVVIGLVDLYIAGKIDLYSNIARDIKFGNIS
jgi:hypothetical protein